MVRPQASPRSLSALGRAYRPSQPVQPGRARVAMAWLAQGLLAPGWRGWGLFCGGLGGCVCLVGGGWVGGGVAGWGGGGGGAGGGGVFWGAVASGRFGEMRA